MKLLHEMTDTWNDCCMEWMLHETVTWNDWC